MPTITFTVWGTPVTQGSAKGFVVPVKSGGLPVINPKTGLPKQRAVITSDSKELKHWRAKVGSAAAVKTNGVLMTGPVSFSVDFYLQRPKSLPKRVTQHITRPDLGKLIRAAEDALTGVVYRDDGQIVTYGHCNKYYCATIEETPRAEFVIKELDALGNEQLV